MILFDCPTKANGGKAPGKANWLKMNKLMVKK